MTNITRSVIRTATPIAVGFVVSVLAHLGIKNPVEVSAIGSVSATVYYGIVRKIESTHPKVGHLLGVLGAPVYPTPTKPVGTAATVTPAPTPERVISPPGNALGYSPTLPKK